MTRFSRPSSLEYPQIYYKFSAQNENSDNEVNYKVQDILEEDFDYAVEILIKHYLPEEPLCLGRNFSEKPEDVEFMGNFYKNLLLMKLSIGCYKEDTNELVGVNIMDVKFKDEVENHEVNITKFFNHMFFNTDENYAKVRKTNTFKA